MAEEKFFDAKTIIIAVLGIAVAGLAYLYLGAGSALTGEKAAEKALAYINTEMLQGQAIAEITDKIEKVSGVYKVNISLNGESFPSYISTDGKLLFPQGIEIKTTTSSESNNNAQVPDKTARPDVKLFVMSYCPYGLQAQKGFLPVYNLLKDKADLGIYFVDYIMHEKQEIDENLRQYCIQKEEPNKFADYLTCFVEAGKTEECLTKTNIDKNKMTNCVQATDQAFEISKNYQDKSTWSNGQFPPFNVHQGLNDQYGVQGSPTLVINGKVISVGRSPEAIKGVICSAFEEAPAECQTELSSTTPSAGFGFDGSGGNDNASCE